MKSDYQFIGLSKLLLLNILPIICLLFMLIGLIFLKYFNYKFMKGAPGLPQKVLEIKDINYETVSFLITYIIPLLFFIIGEDSSEARNFVVLIITIIIIGIIYCRTNLFYTNPTLAILGFQIYKISTKQNKDIIVILKGKLKKDDSFCPRLIDDNIYFIKKVPHEPPRP